MPWIGFIFSLLFGAATGSFINVVVHRLPRGMSLIRPASHCPKCEARLAWYDNVPVLGWLWLRGRCRYCGMPISPQYPLVEATCAGLFALIFAVGYMTGLKPGMSGPGIDETFFILIAQCVLVAALLAATLIDARLFIIPLSIPYASAAVGLVLLPLAAVMFPPAVRSQQLGSLTVRGSWPAMAEERLAMVDPVYQRSAAVEQAVALGLPGPVRISAAPLAGGGLFGAAMGGLAGLALALVLLWRGVLPRSFLLEVEDDSAAPELEPEDREINWPDNPDGTKQAAMLLGPVVGAAVAAVLIDHAWAGWWSDLSPLLVLAAGVLSGYLVVAGVLVVGMVLTGLGRADRDEPEPTDAAVDDDFLDHPTPRLEAIKEIAFVAWPVVGAILGAVLAGAGPWMLEHPAMSVLGGVIAGGLTGGAVVWAVRILGTLGFGKEAMGLGDVHLMIAVGAVGGWSVVVLGFFLAAFIGVAHTTLTVGMGPLLKFRRQPIPFGPHLAAASIIVLIWREPLNAYFGMLLGG